jgi:hypothetical protein
MQPFRLKIARPCPQDWNSMSGGDTQRHCSECNKDVITLAEMSAEEAAELVRKAKPHSLCLRIEHDEAGSVIFRKPSPASNSRPLLMLTIGASLLLNACDEGAPMTPAINAEKNAANQAIAPEKPLSTNSAISEQDGPPPNTIDAEAAPASSAASAPASSAGDRLVKPHGRVNTRITTGCVCAPGDTLCDCL